MQLSVRDVRDGVVLVEYPEASEEEANEAAAALGLRLRVWAPRGLLDAIPGARSLLVLFDASRLRRKRLLDQIELSSRRGAPGNGGRRLFRIPVAYGAEDLSELAHGAGMTAEEFARQHAAPEYRVAFIGFAPGFPYLSGLPSQLHAPRLPSPRPRVAAGRVAIGGPYTGVYPGASPGGWRLIGQTSVRLFDPYADPPALLSAGDRVCFEPVRPEDLPVAVAKARTGANPPGSAVLRVIAPGLFTSIQGAPRHGLGSSGVPAGGAMDLSSLARANGLVGNAPGAPALEIALAGPELEVLKDSVVAIAGGEFAAQWNGKPAPFGEAFRVAAGDRLHFGRARRGARVYLAVEGGVIDSRARGEAVRRLETGDEVAVSSQRSAVSLRDVGPMELAEEILLRVIPGPQADHFRKASIDRFFAGSWRVSPMSDRRGLRLEGEPLAHVRAPEIPSEGTVPGSIQVPGGGLPIVLGPDGPVTGGYPKIATVIGADLALLGQAAPGALLAFRAVCLDEALAAGGSTISVP
jgi:KipI family sensor histidine kinase inhibitor